MGLLSSLFRRGAKAAGQALEDGGALAPAPPPPRIGANGMRIAEPRPFRNSWRGSNDDLLEAARMIRPEDFPQFMALVSAGMSAPMAAQVLSQQSGSNGLT